MCQSRGVVKWHQGCIFSASSSIFRSQHPLGALARCVWRRHICANAGLHRLPGAGLLRRSLVAWGKHPTHALAYCVWRRHSRANVGLHLARQALACCAVGVAWCRLPICTTNLRALLDQCSADKMLVPLTAAKSVTKQVYRIMRGPMGKTCGNLLCIFFRIRNQMLQMSSSASFAIRVIRYCFQTSIGRGHA